MKGAISALASLQGHLLIASGPKIILHKWTGTELNGVAFFDAPPLYVVSLNIVCVTSSMSISLLLILLHEKPRYISVLDSSVSEWYGMQMVRFCNA